MVAADPLAPAMQMELIVVFVTGKIGGTDKPEMRLEASVGQSLSQAGDARAMPSARA